MRFVLLVLLLVSPAFGAEIRLDENTPNEVVAVQALIDRFDDTDYIFRRDPVLEVVPTFAIYAEAAASFGECAINPLIQALDGSRQSRVAAAIGLEIIGPAAIKARPQIIEMLATTEDQILACAIVRGIGSDAVEFVPQLCDLLGSDNFHIQYWVCRALSSIGPGAHQATADLNIELLLGVASVRRNAAIALGNIAPGMTERQLQETVDALESVKDDYSQPVRTAAEEALKKVRLLTNGKVA